MVDTHRIICPWCGEAFECKPMNSLYMQSIAEGHIAACKVKNKGIEIWCPSCMGDMKFKVVDARDAKCPSCGKRLTCSCGKPAKYLCACGHLDCGYHPCKKECGEKELGEALLEGYRPMTGV